jgi:hypothetical protein
MSERQLGSGRQKHPVGWMGAAIFVVVLAVVAIIANQSPKERAFREAMDSARKLTTPTSAPVAVYAPKGTAKLERSWQESGYVYALVSYRNDTEQTFGSGVTIKAIIYDATGGMIDTNERSFFAYEHGPITPGFEGTVKIPIACPTGNAKSVKVLIETAR